MQCCRHSQRGVCRLPEMLSSAGPCMEAARRGRAAAMGIVPGALPEPSIPRRRALNEGKLREAMRRAAAPDPLDAALVCASLGTDAGPVGKAILRQPFLPRRVASTAGQLVGSGRSRQACRANSERPPVSAALARTEFASRAAGQRDIAFVQVGGPDWPELLREDRHGLAHFGQLLAAAQGNGTADPGGSGDRADFLPQSRVRVGKDGASAWRGRAGTPVARANARGWRGGARPGGLRPARAATGAACEGDQDIRRQRHGASSAMCAAVLADRQRGPGLRRTSPKLATVCGMAIGPAHAMLSRGGPGKCSARKRGSADARSRAGFGSRGCGFPSADSPSHVSCRQGAPILRQRSAWPRR